MAVAYSEVTTCADFKVRLGHRAKAIKDRR
jgi:hypothetical protein